MTNDSAQARLLDELVQELLRVFAWTTGADLVLEVAQIFARSCSMVAGLE